MRQSLEDGKDNKFLLYHPEKTTNDILVGKLPMSQTRR
jgi:hypothetical protein